MNPERLCISCMNEKPAGLSICPVCGFDASVYISAPHLLPPLTIVNGRYLLGKALGEGGFGITYIAYDLAENKRVAIKELFINGLFRRAAGTGDIKVDISQGSNAFYNECKDKFLQEAYILRGLEDKQGIVNIYDFFQEHNTAYIVMEYLDGSDLGSYLAARGRISFVRAFELLRPIMHSLISMHKAGVFHRDISPDNIRCLSNGSMKVMDLGSAKYNYGEEWSRIVLVKPGYAPPEQYTSGYKVGPWMDVYAIAATIYKCITGDKPKDSIVRADDNDIILPSKTGAVISRNQERVLLKGLALHPEDRYQDMREFYTALKESAGYAITSPRFPLLKKVSDIGLSLFGKDNKGLQTQKSSAAKSYRTEIARMNEEHRQEKRIRLIAAMIGGSAIGILITVLFLTGAIPFDWISILPWR